VSDAPAASCANVESTRVSHHRHTGSIRLSLHNGFNGLSRALPGDRAFLPPSLCGLTASVARLGRNSPPQNLTPASGRQDHTTSPSATSSFVLRAVTGSRAPRKPKGSPCHHRARRRCRVHRIPPRVRDDREPPLWGRDGAGYRSVSSENESGIFFAAELDADLPGGRCFARRAVIDLAVVVLLLPRCPMIPLSTG
jgi:hypothetical protein